MIAGSGKRMRSSEAPPQRSPAALLDMLKSMEDPAVWAGFQVQRFSLHMPSELQSGTAGLSPDRPARVHASRFHSRTWTEQARPAKL